MGEIPVPIPNTTVKPHTADGTMLATAWKSRWLPGFFIKINFRTMRGCKALQFLMVLKSNRIARPEA